MQTDKTDRRRQHGIDETIKICKQRNQKTVNIRRPSAGIIKHFEGFGHTFSKPDADGFVVLTINTEPDATA